MIYLKGVTVGVGQDGAGLTNERINTNLQTVKTLSDFNALNPTDAGLQANFQFGGSFGARFGNPYTTFAAVCDGDGQPATVIMQASNNGASPCGVDATCLEGVRVQVKIFAETILWLTSRTPPATPTSAGTLGEIVFDGAHIYCCVADNLWRRVALTAW